MTQTIPNCRFCGTKLTKTFVDLYRTPLANSYVTHADSLAGKDKAYDLHARVCSECLLVQADDSVPPDAIFSDYAYFSSYSDSWVEHARRYAISMKERFGLDENSLVVEVASNDGYLLQHFKALNISVLGVEPAANVALQAEAKGIATHVAFFGEETSKTLAEQGKKADLMVANNVLAHAPNTLDFVRGFSKLLKQEGVATFEFPHILNLIEHVQFDTIYHEHFFYLSLCTVEKIFAAAGLRVFDVEELLTHGGSLRLFACHLSAPIEVTPRVAELRAKEHAAHLNSLEGYTGFDEKVREVKRTFLAFIEQAKRDGRKIAAYGAAAKGNTFLNYCGITEKDILCVFDRSSEKQDLLLPGSHLPILAPEKISDIRPDYLIVLPWNLIDEVSEAHDYIKDWGGRFVVAIPTTRILDR